MMASAKSAVLVFFLATLAAGATAQPTAPSLPVPSLSSAYTVSATATLAGLSASMFGPAAQAGFASAVASALQGDPVAVAVTGVTDVAQDSLQASGSAGVAFTVSVASASAASGVASGISAVAADPRQFVDALNNNLAAVGLPTCSGVAVSAPVVAAPPQAAPQALNLSSVDVSAAVSAVTTTLTNLSASAVVEKQTQILSSLAAAAANTTFTPDSASAIATLVLAVVSAAPGAVLSNESQSAALQVLSALSTSHIDATSGVVQTIVSALDSVASSAISGGNPAALAAVLNVINNLAAGQAASLLQNLTPGAPPPPPAVTSTPTIQTLVQVDPPGSNRLTTQPLTAPGSVSAFAPMPAGLLPSDTPLVTQFVSLKFDPNAARTAGGAEINSGVTRLVFTTPNGSAVVVSNAAQPILFTLPSVSLDPESQAACTFWDPVTQTYATNGCVSVPNPQPPNHTLAFIPGYITPDDASLAWAWNISGPMVDGGLCKSAVIDCNSDAPCNGTVLGRSCLVNLDPRNPFAYPAVSCPPLGTASGTNGTAPLLQPVLRVFYGQSCPLWQQNNEYNCHWDNVRQSFNGTGCISNTGASTPCMCRHLTDFAAARRPKVATCSESDMLALNPRDIVAGLKWIFIIVVSAFGLVRFRACYR